MMIKRAALVSLLMTCLPALAAAQSSCPAGSRYATNGSNLAFCIFEDLGKPAGAQMQPYCNYLQSGYIGYDWSVTAASASYSCPDGSRHSSNGAGTDFCIFEVQPPTWAQPYCDYLQDGYIGYSWLICPTGARLASNGAGGEFCIYENIPVPKGAQSYCQYLQDGYFGYSYPLAQNVGYQCPSEFRQATNGADLGFCVAEGLSVPAEPVISPYCDYLADGYIGFAFSTHP
jgi:hypothetical protein